MQGSDKEIFKSGSTTYYWSSKFFPKGVRDDVFKLYSFVRVVDDMVDSIPAETKRFARMQQRWQTVRKQLQKNVLPVPVDDSVDERVLYNIAFIVHRYECDVAWVDAFLASMQMDVDKREYQTLDDTLEYIYGSAEVIGLFMARIMQLPIKPYEYARMQGRAMQYINFLRDIAEDNTLERCYFPKETLRAHGLSDLHEKTIQDNPEAFKEFMHEQLSLYTAWQEEANKGFSYIPKRLLVPLKTAVDMYNWTAEEIKKDPFLVFEKKIKPSKKRVLTTAAKNMTL
jgi:phytoene synthase